MVERIDEWEGRGTIESSTVIQGCSDANRGLVDIGDAEVDFPHDGVGPQIAVKGRGCLRQSVFQLGSNSGIIIFVRQADAACSNGGDVC
jgi:hypothetical protein